MSWQQYDNDPYEEYRERNGCSGAAAAGAIMIIVIIMLCLNGCKAVQPIVQTRDSVRVETRYDSVYIFKHDSVFRDRWRNGDTVFVTVEKWRTQWRDKLVQVHDTITTTEHEEIAVEVVPTYYRNVSTGFWVLLVILLALVGWRIYKIYLKIKTGGVL